MNTQKVITVTLNPSLDRTLFVHYLAAGYHNHTTETTRWDAAGYGMNVSHALHRLGSDTQAVVLLGDDAIGGAYQTLIADVSFPITITKRQGNTRSNMTLVDRGNNTETYIIEESSGASADNIQTVIEVLQDCIDPGDIVVFAGTLPTGLDPSAYATLAAAVHEAGAEVVLAFSGEALDLALGVGPEMVSLKQREAEAYFNFPVRVTDDIVACARKLREKHGVGKVLILLEEYTGAVLDTAEGTWSVEIPEIDEGTLSGVADALLAGLLVGYTQQKPLDDSLALGAAAATYTAAHSGHEFAPLSKLRPIIKKIEVTDADV